jgi:phospholipid/cholesterol/gamma-HCH transport system ATP-binding protein
VIRIDGLSKSFNEPLLEDVTLHVPKGTIWGLMGPAACGKSVLLKLVCGLIKPDAGKLFVDGRDITRESEDALMQVRTRFGMLFQNYALFDFMTVGENVAFPLVRRGELHADEIRARVSDRLRAVGLAGSEEKMPSQLSGGMKKRVGIARATIAHPEIVIYDEPTAGLDPVTTSKIYDLLRADWEKTGATVLLVSSDVDALRGFVRGQRIAMLHKGRLRYDGPADDLEACDDEVVRQFIRGTLDGPL